MANLSIKNFPGGLQRNLKADAATAGVSLQDYIIAALEYVVAKPAAIAHMLPQKPQD